MSAALPPAQPAHLLEQERFVAAVDAALRDFFTTQRTLLHTISPATVPLVDAVAELATGGKRMRALLCYWGWRGAGGAADATEIILAGAALELFQSAALIHDDIIDRSDTRRGGPSVHRRFGLLHAEQGWALDAERFGTAAAILAGDLCLSFSEELFAAIGPHGGGAARAVFNLMRTEVMAGQYLDILEEVSGPSQPHATAVDRACAIITYKSAKYSSEHPLVLGGALAGADAAALAAYSDFALPLGEAFQMRDDVLGVFGDPEQTGKPAGDDLIEGKRTVLVGLTIAAADAADAAYVDAQLGRPELSAADVATLRRIMVDSGALAAAEDMIAARSERAFTALALLPVSDEVRTALTALGRAAVARHA